MFGSHVSKRSGYDLWWLGRLAFVRQLRRNSEAGEPYVAVVVNEHIRRLYILMYKSVPMDLRECSRQAARDVKEARRLQRSPLLPIKD